VFGMAVSRDQAGATGIRPRLSKTIPRVLNRPLPLHDKMACPDPAGGFEDRYFSALQAANRFGFLLGNLVRSLWEGGCAGNYDFRTRVPR